MTIGPIFSKSERDCIEFLRRWLRHGSAASEYDIVVNIEPKSAGAALPGLVAREILEEKDGKISFTASGREIADDLFA